MTNHRQALVEITLLNFPGIVSNNLFLSGSMHRQCVCLPLPKNRKSPGPGDEIFDISMQVQYELPNLFLIILFKYELVDS